MTGITTRQQQMAERAFQAVDAGKDRTPDYVSFAKEFPALIHSAGLCQAVAFALAKKKDNVLNDVVRVMAVAQISDGKSLNAKCLEADVMEYLRLSQLAIQAATWVKRYVEAIETSPQPARDERGSS